MNAPLVIFDTETAALHGAPHLIELGAVRVVDGEVSEQLESLVRPRVPGEGAAGQGHALQAGGSGRVEGWDGVGASGICGGGGMGRAGWQT